MFEFDLDEFTEKIRQDKSGNRNWDKKGKKNYEDDDEDDDRDFRPKKKHFNDRHSRDDRYSRDDRDRDGDRDNNRRRGLPSFSSIAKLYIDSKKNVVNELVEFLNKLKDRSTIKVLKELAKDEDPEAPVIGAAIFDHISSTTIELDDEQRMEYLTVVSKLMKPRVSELHEEFKELKKKHRVSKSLLGEIALIVPTSEIINPKRNIFELVQLVNTRLYSADEIENDDTDGDDNEREFTHKGIKALYTIVFGEENLQKCAIAALLEKKKDFEKLSEYGKSVWEIITDVALEILEEVGNRKEIADLLKMYTAKRFYAGENDSARRVKLKSLESDEYDKIYKAVRDLSEEERYSKWLS